MFTGIVQAVGTLKSMTKRGRGYVIMVDAPESFIKNNTIALGDSIANNGVCLTVTELVGNSFYADVSAETVKCTCFKNYRTGDRLNLELACTASTHLGGHIVQGHVDGIGEVINVSKLDDAVDIWIKAPSELSKYIARKGSIAVDGISLTVNDVENDSFRLTLIPHTQGAVNFDNFEKGCLVNLEVDVLARYLERLFTKQDSDTQMSDSSLLSAMQKNGFF